MKTLFVSFCIFVALTSVHAQVAPLGKLLSRGYASFKDDDELLILISLKDKGNVAKYRSMKSSSFVSEHSLKRRATVRQQSRLIDEQDYPLEQSYVQEIAQRVKTVRHELKWFNAVSAFATKRQVESLRQLPFVTEVELVGRWKRISVDEGGSPTKESASIPSPSTTTPPLNYGTSLTQLNQVNVPAVHNLGIFGQGVTIGMFDNGVRLLNHEAFASMNIIAQHDFVDHKDTVVPVHPPDNAQGINWGGHGTNTLSVTGGYKPGQLIGPAFKANFILARTENDSSETPVEEDNWAAGIQWADSIGVDVTSTSLGYLGFDTPYPSWTANDMNGNTTLITRAADYAVGLGIVVLNSAGNSGAGDGVHNTLGAPADGDSVITVGAVTSAGVRSGFSSVGPTTDVPARIKPDIMAMGTGPKEASGISTTGYVNNSGTSYSCPLAAGVAALIRCANPTLTPMQVREALRQTASNAASPNNLVGWGIINADSAIKYFGALPQGQISGTKFNDLNGNGVKDPGEPGVSSVWIHLTGAMTESTLTDGSGNFHFDSLAIGTFTISETTPSGWVQTLPAGGGSYSVTLLFQADTAGFNFGNFLLGSIVGMKFDDANGNGIKEGGETGLSNWVIHLTGPETLRTTTDVNGNYLFSNIEPGTYSLSESTQTGWVQTLPPGNASYSITMRSGLDTTGLLFGNASAPEFTYHVNADWNLLSLPQDLPDHGVLSLYPSSSSKAFIYTNGSGYQSSDSVFPGEGYWLKFPSAQDIVIAGTLRSSENISLPAGWSMIGALSTAVAVSSVDDPDTIIISPFYGYNGSYLNADSIRPHEGYWVRTKTSGTISIHNPRALPLSVRKNPFESIRDNVNSITITDRRGIAQTLYFGHNETFRQTQEWFTLPPIPPEAAFDVRFNNGKTAWSQDLKSMRDAMMILTQGISYPAELSWSIKEPRASYIFLSLQDKTTRTMPELRGSGTLTINTPGTTSFLLEQSASTAELPMAFRLDQNFPNPFNPATTIHYTLPEKSTVSIIVFDVLGQKISILIDGIQQEAGDHMVTFDASALPSGMYYYKMTAGSFIDVKKMMLVR